jgi:hypothetical protein
MMGDLPGADQLAGEDDAEVDSAAVEADTNAADNGIGYKPPRRIAAP